MQTLIIPLRKILFSKILKIKRNSVQQKI